MVERIVEEIAIVVTIRVDETSTGVGAGAIGGAATSGAAAAVLSTGRSFGDIIERRLQSIAFGQINALYRKLLTGLFSGGKKTTVVTTTHGGESQFSPPSGLVTALPSTTQNAAGLARTAGSGERNG
jgi:hypothetical protein